MTWLDFQRTINTSAFSLQTWHSISGSFTLLQLCTPISCYKMWGQENIHACWVQSLSTSRWFLHHITLASTLISHNQRLRSILAFGTDGDKGIIEAFLHNFFYALQFRCFVHFKKNVQETLRWLGLPKPVSEQFIADIFGKQYSSFYKEGLVDCSSEQVFDDMLEQLKTTWNCHEIPHVLHAVCSKNT